MWDVKKKKYKTLLEYKEYCIEYWLEETYTIKNGSYWFNNILPEAPWVSFKSRIHLKNPNRENIMTRVAHIYDINRYRDMRHCIVWDFEYRFIMIWHQCDVIFWTYQTLLHVIILTFTHLVIMSTLLMIIYDKSNCANVLWK